MYRQSYKVSVVVPNYNHAGFLKERLDSVFNQSYQNFEVIILDDCSTDNSRDIIELYRGNERVACIVYNGSNSGSAFKQWQKGLQYASGDYIWIAESDDWCEDNFLEILVNGIEGDPRCSIAFAQTICVDGNNDYQWETYYHHQPGIIDGREFTRQYMLYKNSILNASMAIFRSKFINDISLEYTSYTYCGDWLFWIELAALGDVFISDQQLNYFRKHDHDVTGKALANGVNIIEESKVITIMFQKKILTLKEYRALLFRCYAKYSKAKKKYNQQQNQNILQSFEILFESKSQFRNFILYSKVRNILRLLKKGINNASG